MPAEASTTTCSPPRLNLIGAGAVGRSFALHWQRAGVFRVTSILSGSRHTASTAAAAISAGDAVCSLAQMQEAEYLMVAVPDQELEHVIAQLLETPTALPRACIFHMSGAQPRSVFKPLAQVAACAYARLHPVMTFPKNRAAVELADSFCLLDADEPERSFLESALLAIGVSAFELESSDVSRYHAANVFASNFLQALLHASFELYQQLGVSEERARQVSAKLVRSSVENALSQGPVEALTGPIRRGDRRTIEEHVESLRAGQPELARLYAVLSLQTLRMLEGSSERLVTSDEEMRAFLCSYLSSQE